MKASSTTPKLLVAFGVLAVPVVLLGLVFSLVAWNEPLLVQYQAASGSTEHAALHDTLEYLRHHEPLRQFTEREQLHMADVRQVIDAGYAVVLCGIIILFLLPKRLLKPVVWYGGLLSVLLILLTLVAALNFNMFFAAFHSVVFPQGNYLFPADSLLIQTFPEAFFLHVAQAIGVLFLICSVLTVGVGRLLHRNHGARQAHTRD